MTTAFWRFRQLASSKGNLARFWKFAKVDFAAMEWQERAPTSLSRFSEWIGPAPASVRSLLNGLRLRKGRLT